MEFQWIKELLDAKKQKYNTKKFIENDPILIPHLFKKKLDIEISAFFTCIFAWGKRSIIIKKSKEFLELMDNDPHNFILNCSNNDINKFQNFKHRTFNFQDARTIINFLKYIYKNFSSLEDVFCIQNAHKHHNVKNCLINFHNFYLNTMNNDRTKKHISTPKKKSACKKINMFLRWMVRKDKNGVDFGLWKKIKSSSLIIPCDIHVLRISNSLGLLNTTKSNWNNAEALTDILKSFDVHDPISYDFALFGLGIEKK